MSPGPAPVSCYIRALNEERMIGRVIEAARAAVAEVVVLDSGSTDRTCEIARAAGARVIAQPWLGNGRQKRAAEDACAHDWLLDLDADEVVTDELAAEIRALFADGPPAHAVFELRLLTQPPFGRRWERAAVAWRRKLYDRRALRMPDHAAWDQLEPPRGMKIGRLRGALAHHSFRDVEQFVAKLNRVSSVRATETRLRPFWSVALRVVAAPPVYFLKHWLQRGLWREGLYGFAIAGASAFGRWLRDVKMLERHYARRRDDR
ncbi:MAG: glycosyltransferase family 2 protein [Rubrimonas sp.]|uniref:glycosyltransferase family 2 protein n=1 Tax=Rubrimonas sp. TaxID=2036015 RepID=UPI003DCAE444